jgi:hypothetical protein
LVCGVADTKIAVEDLLLIPTIFGRHQDSVANRTQNNNLSDLYKDVIDYI